MMGCTIPSTYLIMSAKHVRARATHAAAPRPGCLATSSVCLLAWGRQPPGAPAERGRRQAAQRRGRPHHPDRASGQGGVRRGVPLAARRRRATARWRARRRWRPRRPRSRPAWAARWRRARRWRPRRPPRPTRSSACRRRRAALLRGRPVPPGLGAWLHVVRRRPACQGRWVVHDAVVARSAEPPQRPPRPASGGARARPRVRLSGSVCWPAQRGSLCKEDIVLDQVGAPCRADARAGGGGGGGRRGGRCGGAGRARRGRGCARGGRGRGGRACGRAGRCRGARRPPGAHRGCAAPGAACLARSRPALAVSALTRILRS